MVRRLRDAAVCPQLKSLLLSTRRCLAGRVARPRKGFGFSFFATN